MKLYITKLSLIILFLLFLISFKVDLSHAARVPDIDGYVYNAQTKAPISGVWVGWAYSPCTTGNCDCEGLNSQPPGVRYARTNSSGYYEFPAWNTRPNSDWTTYVDIDLDGSNDTTIQPLVRCSNGITERGSFGCYSNPHRFFIVKPSGWSGNVDSISGISFANDSANFSLPTLFYRPPAIPTATKVPPQDCESSSRPNSMCVDATKQGCPKGFDSDPLYSCQPGFACCTKIGAIEPSPTPGGLPTPTYEPGATWTPTPIPPPTSTPAPGYQINGSVFFDDNENGIKDLGEFLYNGGITVTIYDVADVSSIYRTTDSFGNYAAAGLLAGQYRVTGFAPGGYRLTTPSTINVTLGPNTRVDFGISGTFTVSGSVFVDRNKNKIKDAGEVNYPGAFTIDSPGGFDEIRSGSYTITYNRSGVFTISLTSPLSDGYIYIHPLNGPPPSYTVTIGPGCTVNGAPNGVCDANGNITSLHFAVSDSIPWMQSIGADLRIDNGVTNFVASNPTCSGAYTNIKGTNINSGIIFSGDINPKFGKGNSSVEGWVVGGSNYAEVFSLQTTNLASSYDSILSSINKAGTTINNLASICNLSNCTLPNGLAGGVYQANGNLNLNQHRFRNNEKFIFLIDGDLTLLGEMDVPIQSSVVFTANNDIIIDRSVGSIPSCTAPANIQGFYSADRNVTVQGYNNCSISSDQMLTFEGAVIVNAARVNGVFTNQRDLCTDNYNYPSIIFKERANFVTNAITLLKRRVFNFREEAP